jgi:hypothetical protein
MVRSSQVGAPRGALLDTPGKRVYALILGLALLYAGAHLVVGPVLIVQALLSGSVFVALVIGLTVLTALAGAGHIAQSLVFSAILLVRGPRRFVAPPPPVEDSRLPFVVIQIPGRNEPFEEVVRSIESGLALDYPADRLLIQHIDNSDDDRWRAVERHYRGNPRLVVLHRQGTAGAKAGNLNLGLAALPARIADDPRGVLFGILDVGDTFAPLPVRPMAAEFVRDQGLAFVQSITRIANPADTLITRAEGYLADATFRFFFGMQNTYGMPNLYGHHMLIRARHLAAVGNWDESKVAEDWSTAVRMLSAGGRGKWVDYHPADPAFVSAEMSPATLDAQQKQKSRWATGAAELIRDHAGGWLRAPLPWNQRADLMLRLWFYPTRVLQLVGRLMLPLWVSLAVLTGEGSSVPEFGLMSASMQSAWLIYRGAEAVSYLREGDPRRAGLLLLHVPLQTAYTLAMIPQVARGVLRGLGRSVNSFVVTPKRIERIGLLRNLVQQREALALASVAALPAVLLFGFGDEQAAPLGTYWLLTFAGLTVAGVFLVPGEQAARRLWQGAMRWRRGKVPRGLGGVAAPPGKAPPPGAAD